VKKKEIYCNWERSAGHMKIIKLQEMKLGPL